MKIFEIIFSIIGMFMMMMALVFLLGITKLFYHEYFAKKELISNFAVRSSDTEHFIFVGERQGISFYKFSPYMTDWETVKHGFKKSEEKNNEFTCSLYSNMKPITSCVVNADSDNCIVYFHDINVIKKSKNIELIGNRLETGLSSWKEAD